MKLSRQRTTHLEHERVQRLLPWLVNDSLVGRERVSVMAHLGECAYCRAERDRLQALQAVISREDLPASDYRPAFKKLMQRIDSNIDANIDATIDATIDANKKARIGSRRKTELPLPVSPSQWASRRFGLAAVAAGLVLGIGVYLVSGLDTAPPYETLNQTTTVQGGLTRRVAVGFEQPLDQSSARAVFIETSSYILSGPDAEGNYLVEMMVPAGSGEVAFLEALRQREGIRYASYVP